MRLLDGSLQSGQHAWRGAFERTSAPHGAQTHWWPHGTKACVLSASRHTQHRLPCSAARSSLGLAAPPEAPLAPAPPAAPPLPAAAEGAAAAVAAAEGADGAASKKALAAVCTQPSAARSRRRSSASGGAPPTMPRKEASAAASASAASAAADDVDDDAPAPSDAAAAGPTLTALARTSVPAAGVGRPATASVRASVALSAWYAWKSSRRLGVGRCGQSATSTEPHGHEAASHRALGD